MSESDARARQCLNLYGHPDKNDLKKVNINILPPNSAHRCFFFYEVIQPLLPIVSPHDIVPKVKLSVRNLLSKAYSSSPLFW